MRDLYGSWHRADTEWTALRANGTIREHRIGPWKAVYELPDKHPVALFLETVRAQFAVDLMRPFPQIFE